MGTRIFIILLSLFIYWESNRTFAQNSGLLENEVLICTGVKKSDSLFLAALVEKEKGNLQQADSLLRIVVQQDTTAFEVYYYLAEIQKGINSENHSSILNWFNKAIALAPNEKQIKESLANYYIEIGDRDKAIETYQSLIEQTIKPYDYLVEVLQLQLSNKNYFEDALKTLQKIEKISDNKEQIWRERFRVYSELGNDLKALEALDELCKLNTTELLYRTIRASMYMQTNQLQKGVAEANYILERDGDNIQVLQILLKYYADLGEKDTADSLLLRLLKQKDYSDVNKLGILKSLIQEQLESKTDSSKLLPFFEASIINASEEEVPALYLDYLIFLKYPKEFQKEIAEKIIQRYPSCNQARSFLLQDALMNQDLERASELCKEGVKTNSDQLIYYYYEAMLKRGNKKYEDALRILLDGKSCLNNKSITASLCGDFYGLLGSIYYDLGDKEKAFLNFDTCLMYNGNDYLILNNYAYFLFLANQNIEKANEMSYKAVEAEPDNATYLDTYARILFKQKKYKKALEYVQRIVAILEKEENEEEDNASLWKFAGDVFSALKNKKEANYCRKKAKEKIKDTLELQKK